MAVPRSHDMFLISEGKLRAGEIFEKVSREQFEAGRNRRWGTSNPEEMHIPFWNAMVEIKADPFWVATRFAPDYEESPLKSMTQEEREEYHKEVEKVEPAKIAAFPLPDVMNRVSEDPGNDLKERQWYNATWCGFRWYNTQTKLPDGTIVEIGGEWEDPDWPDFMIYNDVFVREPTPATAKKDNTTVSGGGAAAEGRVRIYAYPKDVFPPTDGHTATFHSGTNSIYIIGNDGYETAENLALQKSGETPVYRLEIGTWKMEKVIATGDSPGWLYEHEAKLVGNDEVRISGDGENARRFIPDTEGHCKRTELKSGETWTLNVVDKKWRRGP